MLRLLHAAQRTTRAIYRQGPSVRRHLFQHSNTLTSQIASSVDCLNIYLQPEKGSKKSINNTAKRGEYFSTLVHEQYTTAFYSLKSPVGQANTWLGYFQAGSFVRYNLFRWGRTNYRIILECTPHHTTGVCDCTTYNRLVLVSARCHRWSMFSTWNPDVRIYAKRGRKNSPNRYKKRQSHTHTCNDRGGTNSQYW